MVRSGVPNQATIVHPLMSPEAPAVGGRLTTAFADRVRRKTQYASLRHSIRQDISVPRSLIGRFPPHRDAWLATGLNATFPFRSHSLSWEMANCDGASNFAREDWPPDQPNGPCRQLVRATRAVPLSRTDRPQAAPKQLPPMWCRLPVGDSHPSILAMETMKSRVDVPADDMKNRAVGMGDGASNLDVDLRGTSISNSVPCGDVDPSPQDLSGCHLGRRHSETDGRRQDPGDGLKW